ncbi:hypothetical protein GFS60_08062 (plasmid) [Rhodococcus sp. WAY2]|nr:hypothetical protein GFS60_08062 [Rhodococcus sp. WAY2]
MHLALLTLADQHLSVPTDKGADAGRKVGTLAGRDGRRDGPAAPAESPTWRCCGTGRWGGFPPE